MPTVDQITIDHSGAIEITPGTYDYFECASVQVAELNGAPPISAVDAVEAFAQGFALFVPVAAAIWGGRVILKLLRKG